MEINSDKLRRKVENLEQLPTLPSVLRHILVLTRSTKTSASDVGEMISHDPALTSKISGIIRIRIFSSSI